MRIPPQDVITTVELPGVRHVRSGKVREVFDLGEVYLFVATDRVSAYDCVLPDGIPGKGRILTQLSVFWFERFCDRVPHHLVTWDADAFPPELAPHRALLEGRSMLVRKAEMIPVECVARGYLAGSGWREYQADGKVAGQTLPAGYRQSVRLAEPIFTPATKAESGHDINISFAEMCERVGTGTAEHLRDLTLTLYADAAAYALDRGILIADTKFEFGLIDGEVALADEVLTPDSSRFWEADAYREGESPFSFDKQFIRDYLDTLAWDKTPPAPPLPEDIVRQTSEKYVEAFRRLTGRDPAW
jgi:phosphoribosylaminoimidazole-succinocarboxamide synthase